METQCVHFARGACRFGNSCVVKHGDLDQRPLCTECGCRIPCGIMCAKCAAIPGETYCRHFQNGECRYGDDCTMIHGDDDTRDLCVDCERVRTAQERCRACYKIVKEERERERQHRVNERAQEMDAKLACKQCGARRQILIGSHEFFCKACQTATKCSRCPNMTTHKTCRACTKEHEAHLLRRCETCNAKIYPGSFGCEYC